MRENRECVMLVHNRPLLQYSKQLDPSGGEAIYQWLSWFGSLFKEEAKQRVPKLPPTASGYQAYDWKSILITLEQLPLQESPSRRPSLVVDEGQDMPPDFYRAIVELGFEDIFVLADQNQQITDEHSSRRDLIALLALAGMLHKPPISPKPTGSLHEFSG